MNIASKKIAFLNRKLALIEKEREEVLNELKSVKRKCDHEYLVGGISIDNDEIYYCLSCRKKVFRSKTDAKVMIDLKDYLTPEEYASSYFNDIFDNYYGLAQNILDEMIIRDAKPEIIEAALSNELVYYLEEYRSGDRGR